MTIIIILILGWLCASYYPGPIALVIGWGCKIGLGAILINRVWGWYKNFLAGAPERQKRRAERQARRRDPDPKPRPEDFRGYIDSCAMYKEALAAWEERMKKRIVYELPVETAVNMDDAFRWYWKEVSTRNPNRYRGLESQGFREGWERCYHCDICGKARNGKIENLAAVCDDCAKLYDYNTFRKKVPTDLPAASVYSIWVRQMIAATDCKDGVISNNALEHELKLAIALEYKILEQRKKEAQLEETAEYNRRRFEEQKRDNVVSAQRLL